MKGFVISNIINDKPISFATKSCDFVLMKLPKIQNKKMIMPDHIIVETCWSPNKIKGSMFSP